MLQVESGEGIESLRIAIGFSSSSIFSVESGEGIESSHLHPGYEELPQVRGIR